VSSGIQIVRLLSSLVGLFVLIVGLKFAISLLLLVGRGAGFSSLEVWMRIL